MNFLRIGLTVIEKSPPKHDQKWTDLCDLLPTGVAGDIISGENVKAIEGYAALNIETASVSIFREN